MTIAAGTRLGRYEIRSKLGAGGMGEVYLALDTKLDRKVALKILPAEVAADHGRMSRFEQEAKAASALNHPNILTIYEIDKADSVHFIATEFIDGQTLRQRTKSAPLKLSDVLDVTAQIASALAAAHAAGIVHRDIKPENIMLRRDGIAKVLDFGLAKLTEQLPLESVDTEAPTSFKTDPGTVVGTAVYMSPEQARGMAVDARTDIFSLGGVLYEMVAGRLPFEGTTSSEVLASILSEKEPQPLARYSREAPAELERIVSKTLRKDREERYQTAKDMLLDLRNLRRKLDVDAEIERTVAPEFRSTSSGTSRPRTQSSPPNAEATKAAQVHTASSAEYVVSGIKRHKLAAGLGVLALIASVIGLSLYLRARKGEAAIKSIAVMPFVNESGNADFEYLSDGMTETLISSLSQLPNLNVKARSSVFRYKGKDTNSQTVGRELNVQAILNGRVIRRGDQLTLSLELIDAQTENVIWSEQYNRKQTDLITLQSEIARDVSSKLKTKLSGADEAKVTKTYTANPEAYQLYLKGRFQWNKRTGESLKKAVEFYQQAIAKDPNYALAYAGLAQSYVIFNNYSVASAKDSMPQAKAAALRALELDDSLDEAHAALGLYLSAFAWNQPAAEKELRRAIELNPNNATAYQWLGIVLALAIGRFDEGIAAARRAEELDPLSPIISADSGFCLFGARRYDEAIAQLKRALTLDPNFYYTRFNLGTVYHAKGMYSEAIVEYRKARELDDDPFVTALLARSLAKSGGRGEAAKLRDQLRAETARRYVPNIAFALVYAALDDKDEAFKWLEKDFAERTYFPSLYAFHPLLDDLRDDPRFADLVRRVESAKMV